MFVEARHPFWKYDQIKDGRPLEERTGEEHRTVFPVLDVCRFETEEAAYFYDVQSLKTKAGYITLSQRRKRAQQRLATFFFLSEIK